MSYLALARKYRPQDFAAVAAQDFITSTLQNAIKLDRVAHAYLFTGPRGVGKTSTARIFAKALNCLRLKNASPCGECENCVEITNGTSLDVAEIDGASNRGVDEIRLLRENVKFVPLKSKYKIYIVDEVHMLTKEAFNALLKTLEEPPKFAVFIFATTDAQKVPATILSRCQRYEFKKIPYKEMFENMKNILSAENIEYEEDALNFIIRNSDGGMRDALSILDQVIAYAGGKVDAKSAALLTGVSDKYLIDKIFAAVLKEEPSFIPPITEEIDAKGMDYQYAAECLIEHTRNMLFMTVTGEPAAKELTGQEKEFYQSLKKYASKERLYALFQIFRTLCADMKYCDFPRYVFEFAAFKGASISKVVPLPKTFAGTEATPPVEQVIAPKPMEATITPALVKPKTDEAMPQMSATDIWNNAAKIIDEKGGPTASYLSYGTLQSATADKITIAFPEDRNIQYNYFNKPDKKEYVQKLVSSIASPAPRVEFILQKIEGDKKKVALNDIKSYKEKQIEKTIKDDPFVRAVMEQMGGEIESVDFFGKNENK